MIRAKIPSGLAIIAAILTLPVLSAQKNVDQDFGSIVSAAQGAQAWGDFSTAATYYRQAVKLRPDIAELWANLGLMEDLGGNPSGAIKSFSEAARLNGSMFVPQLFLGIDYLKLNRPETAIPFLQRAEQLNPKDLQAPLALGRAYALSGQGDRSSDAYLRVLNLSPDNGDAWLGLGMAGLQQSAADDRAMTATYKDSSYAKLRAGETFTEQGQLTRASSAYESALLAKSNVLPCTHAEYGLLLMREQELAKARSEFEQELKPNSACSLAVLGLAALHLKQGATEEALKSLVKLWQSDRGFLQENLPMLGDALSDEQRVQLLQMVNDLQANESASGAGVAEGQQPDDRAPQQSNEMSSYLSGQYQKCSDILRPRLSVLAEPSLSHLAFCAYYTGDYKTASAAARRLKSNPATRAGGLYWESRADQKLAVAALSRAGETATNSPQLHILLGDIYRQKQRWDDAETEYRKALALESHNQSATLGLALALFEGGKNRDALTIDKTLLADSPDHPDGNLLAGEILVREGQYTDAETYLKRIRDKGQKSMPRVHTLLGQIYFATDHFPEALTEFRLGLASDDDGSVHFQLGRTYQKLGQKDKAEEAFRASKQLRQRADDSSIAPQQ